MKPFKRSLLTVGLFGGLALWTPPLLASTVQVGTCLPGVKSYSTITAAVEAVSAGSTVKVCPGTYPEQFIISTPLTLEGVVSGNSDRVVIAAAGANLASNVDSIFGDPVVAQVLVIAGPVNISNITVDGTGNNQNSLVDVVGIFYASGSSGTVNGVTTRQQSGNGRGYGIWAENGNTTLESVTIENCDVHDVDVGIFVGSNQSPPTLTPTIQRNMIVGHTGVFDLAGGNITNNIIAAHFYGIAAGNGAYSSVLSNTITMTNPSDTLARKGILIGSSGATVKSNSIFNLGAFEFSTTGIYLVSSGNTVESNTIKDADTGIELLCKPGNTVSGNTIWDVYLGIDQVPSTQTGTNTYRNVDFIKSGC